MVIKMNTKLAVALAILALLLPGMIIICDTPSASAASSYGRVTVSGKNILIGGQVTSEQFYGVVETTALQNAILAYIYGQTGVAGKTSHLNGPDTSKQGGYIPYHKDAEEFWDQYFAITAYYHCNLVRMGAGDRWGTSIQYEAWLYHHDEYINLLKVMCAEAEEHGVYLCFVIAGSQEVPAYTYGGIGSVFDTASTAYAHYITYAKDTMQALDGQNAIFMYDVFNEPDHDQVYQNYWRSNGGKTAFNTWAKAVAAATFGVSTHPRTMGVAGMGLMFGWGQSDFNLATGSCGFEILHRHFYAQANDAYLFADPEAWADAVGKPLFWGELGYNGVYPLIKWTFGEESIRKAGGQLICTMVLTGTANYPYTGGYIDPPVTSAPADNEETIPPADDGAVIPDTNNSTGTTNETTDVIDDSNQASSSTNDTAAGNAETNDTAAGNAKTNDASTGSTDTRTVNSWRSNWLRNLFGWINWPIFGSSSSLAKPVSMQSTSSFSSSSAYALGGTSGESSLAMISLAATAALAGAYFVISRKMN